jgi:SPP1 family predicted phage head-tail adaptor
MPLLSEAALAHLGKWFEDHLFNDDCTIERQTRVQTPSGGSTLSWTDIATVKGAIVDAGSPQETLLAAQEVGYITKLAMLPRNTDIRGNDRIRVGAVTYTVIDLYEPSTYVVMQRVLVRRSSFL